MGLRFFNEVLGGSVPSSKFLCFAYYTPLYSLRPRLNRRPFTDDILKCIFLNENEWILPRISLKFVPEVRINNIPALVQIMAWRRPGDKPLSEPMMVRLPTHICVSWPQWVNICHSKWMDWQYYSAPRTTWVFGVFGCQLDEPYGFAGDH